MSRLLILVFRCKIFQILANRVEIPLINYSEWKVMKMKIESISELDKEGQQGIVSLDC